jgi:hypothetical protein
MVKIEPNDYQKREGIQRVYTLRTLGPSKPQTALRVKYKSPPELHMGL